MNNSTELTAEERKRKRLEAWRKRQQQKQQPAVKVSLSLKSTKQKAKRKPIVTKKPANNPFLNEGDGDDEESSDEELQTGRKKRPLDLMEDLTRDEKPAASKRAKTSSRWDNAPAKTDTQDVLDQFMNKLEAGASGTVTAGESLKIHVGSSMMRPPAAQTAAAAMQSQLSPISGSVITAADLQKLKKPTNSSSSNAEAIYQPKDWLSDVPSDTDDEHEEEARRALIEALKSAPVPGHATEEEAVLSRPAQTVAELKSEKSRREERLRQLEEEAAQARKSSEQAVELGRLYEDEGGIMEEAERNLQAAKAAPDALTVLAELNKKKELKAVDHSKIEYLPFQKNLYRVPRSLADLTNDDVINRRAKLRVRVRGHGAPAPVSTFAECGLSEKIVEILRSQKITKPFPVQAQCIPCIMGTSETIFRPLILIAIFFYHGALTHIALFRLHFIISWPRRYWNCQDW